MTMGRPNKGIDHVDNADGSEHAKQRVKLILKTVLGELSVRDACDELDISEKRFWQLRQACMQGAVEGVEPGRPGRPVKEDAEASAVAAEMRAEIDRLTRQVERQRIKLDLIEEIPELAKRAQKGGRSAIDRAVKSLRRR